MTASDPKVPEPDISGQTLDRYRLVRRLGVGGMGAVYEAEHTRLRKRFAVKLLRHDLARDETFRRRFLREARAASAITHPNVVAISDFGETDDDQVFFVMEMLAGRDLQALLEAEGKLPWPRTRDILVQITSALQAAHAQDIIHRDMKPSNVFLADVAGKEGEDYVKVLDFGIAKLSGQTGEATAKLTSTDEIFGTVAYMAPEMAMGVNDDRRSDVYAVGVMMYRMLTGALPYTQGNAFQILSQHINAPLPPPREKEPSISQAVEAILLRALAKRPEDRFASIDDFVRALRRGMLEATESLVGVHADLLSGTPKQHAGASATTIDKTTPLPASGVSSRLASGPMAGAPPLADAAAEAAAVPLAVSSTVVSSPIVVAPGAAQAPVGFDSGSTRLPTASHGRPRSLLPRFLLLGFGVAALAMSITLLVMRDREPSDASPTQTAAAPDPMVAKPSTETQTVAPPKVELTPTVKQPPEAPELGSATPTADPVDTPAPGPADDPVIAEPPEPTDDPAGDEPTMTASAGDAAPKPKPKPKTKPKTDAEVVAGLKAKLGTKCKKDGSTKVKVEGMITSSGTTTGLLITPSTGPGECASGIVSKARFDATAGPRPIPRFSVEL